MRRRVTALRRVGSGVSMIVAPLLLLTSSALGPPHRASQQLADELPHIAANPNRFLTFVLVSLVAQALLVPAVMGIAHLLRGRRAILALIGMALTMVGILSYAVVHGVQLVQQQMVHAADQEQMIALLQRLEAGIGLKAIFLVFILGLFLGWVILSIGMFTTPLVPRAVPISVLASLVLNFAGLELLSRFFFLVGLAWLGVAVVTMPDEVWLSAAGGAEPASI
jgi:hypothetical protein